MDPDPGGPKTYESDRSGTLNKILQKIKQTNKSPSLFQDEHKFELCDVIRTILRSFPKSNFDEESWLPMLQRGLHDILFSKISKRQRDPAMQLVAAVIEVSGTRPEAETRFMISGEIYCVLEEIPAKFPAARIFKLLSSPEMEITKNKNP
jgi:hypothetical protein